MSYASYEQEQQDQEMFQKLVAVHKAKEQNDRVVTPAQFSAAEVNRIINNPYAAEFSHINWVVSEPYASVEFTDIAPCNECNTKYEKK